MGIAVDVAAYTLGASVVERHYTLDRTWKGTDHAASLEPDGISASKKGDFRCRFINHLLLKIKKF